MKSKTKNILKWAITGITTLIVTMIACLKLVAFAPLVEIYAKIGLQAYIQILGVSLLLFLSLFLWKPTMKIGLLLLTGYFGGAMAVELSNGTPFIAPATILTLIWVSAFLRDASIFKASVKNERLATSF
jgi:hypothetical protein